MPQPRRKAPEGRSSRRAVAYLRRSTDRQEQSIGDQKAAIEAYAAEHGYRLTKFYTDDAISGTTTAKRRAFQQMIEDAGQKEASFEAVIVYDVKRFGRVGNDEAGYFRHLLRQGGVEVLYVSENFTGDSTDDLLRPVKQWQARQESKDLSKVVIRGLISKFNEKGGWWMGGVPPHGYDLCYEDAGGKFLFVVRFMADGSKQLLDETGGLLRTLARGESLSISQRDRARLVPGRPDRVETIRRMFRLYVQEGRGFGAVANALNAEKVPTPRGPQWAKIYSGRWACSTVRAILVNPLYGGDMVWNRRTDGRFHRVSGGRAVERETIHGHRLVPNDESDWMIERDTHPALIDRHLLQAAKQRLKPEESTGRPRGHGKAWQGMRSRYILSGLMTCARCGSRYQGFHRNKGKRRKDGSVVKTYSYGCGGYIRGGRSVCELGSIPQEKLESAVIQSILDYYKPYLGQGGKTKLAKVIRKQMGGGLGEIKEARGRLEAEQQTVGEKIGNLLDNLTKANRSFVDKRLKALKVEQEQLARRRDELECLELAQDSIEEVVSDVGRAVDTLDRTLHQGLPQEKMAMLRLCVEGIDVDSKMSLAEAKLRRMPDSRWDQPVETMVVCL